MTVPAIQTRVTQAGSINPVTAAPVGTVAFLSAVLSKISLWAAIFTQLSIDSGWAAAGPRHWITSAPILAEAGKTAVSPKCAFWTGLVAENSTPAILTVAAHPVQVAHPSVLTVVTGQAAVMAKSVLQADEFLSQGVLPSGFCLLFFLIILIIKELGELIPQDSYVRERTDNRAPTIQSFHRLVE